MSVSSERLRDPRQRAERAATILDVAADLLLRHGYRRVTIDDVAAGAGIGKGTVYLHWKTREQLFGAVFAREVLDAVDELRQALRDDPRVSLLHRFARTYFLAIAKRPLLRGFLLGDPDLLGKLTGSPGTGRDDRHAATLNEYFRLLARHGLLRDDLSADEVGYAYQATFEGFLRAESAVPVDDPERRAELLARTVRRAFESDSPASDATVGELADVFVTLLGELVDADRADFGIPPA
ncbi:TetR/AcrR family transcriptional regulator [Sphaerisporangium fuscum]|uniref:TetR/AcrR family transcriptional regulator n=1 Tax=Sphaerisporangium fuscum TaxID=2835868 RepID=UPI001BDC7FFD|nr:TetR/AcrR family transcriptional regulator [Sphaerisporangium fuscum]